MKQKKLLRTIAVAAAVLVAVVSVGLIQRSSTPQTATIQFFSNNSAGYACFLNYSDTETGGPICMSDMPSLGLPSSATVPVGNYSIVFFPFDTASNQTLWEATNNIQVTGWAPYDVSSAYANVTINGDGAIAVFVLPLTTMPVTEYVASTPVAFVAVAISMLLLRRPLR